MNDFPLTISYSQIAVFAPDLEQPFNEWLPQHTEQGFSWRRDSISFRTVEEAGEHTVHTTLAQTFQPQAQNHIAYAVQVPFEVDSSGQVEIASISDGRVIELAEGSYSLYCEILNEKHIYLSFIPDKSPEFKVLHPLAGTNPEHPLLIDSQPA